MVLELMTLPLRLSVRAANLMLRGAGEVADRVFSVVSPAAEAAQEAPAREPVQEAPATEPVQEEPAREPARQREPERPPPTVEAQAPPHVSEEPALVEERADPGAEEGARAEVTVIEPWSGYDQLTATEVLERLGDATPAELAAVQLYERGHRQRETVIAAVARALQLTSGGRSTTD